MLSTGKIHGKTNKHGSIIIQVSNFMRLRIKRDSYRIITGCGILRSNVTDCTIVVLAHSDNGLECRRYIASRPNLVCVT